MNARLYDPVLGRFLAPDPVVTDPSSLLDFNRYMYARNNPMLYTDESGESWKSFWHDFAAAWKRDWNKFISGFDGGTVGPVHRSVFVNITVVRRSLQTTSELKSGLCLEN